MKKQILLFSALLLTIALLPSCGPVEPVNPNEDLVGDYFPRINSDNLITAYAPASKFRADQHDNNINVTVRLDYDNEVRSFDYYGFSFYDRSEFLALAEAHGDTALHDVVASSVPGYTFGDHYALNVDIDSIHISSYDPYDQDHPANTSLNDLFDIKFHDTYNYIQAGYPDYNPQLNLCVPLVTKPLAEATSEDIRMIFSLSNAFTLIPHSLPDAARFPLYITLYFSDGTLNQLHLTYTKQ